MTLEEIIKQKISRLTSVPDAFVSRVDKAQLQIFDKIIDLLDTLERDSEGRILVSQKNLAISEVITTQLRQVIFDTDYLEALKDFAKEFDAQAKINLKYFDTTFNHIDNKAIFDQILKSSQLSALELLSEDAVAKNYINPLKDLLNASITGNATFTETIKSLRTFTITDSNGDGELLRYVKTIAYDAFAFSDRQYTKVVAETIGAEWYKYSGGELETSRPFCIEYHNQYFHKKEIEDFGRGIDIDRKELTDEMLQGRYPGTTAATIWTLAGGWNCRHSILPVSVSSVPASVVNRNVAKGYYKAK